jgi:hypothetical protein
MLKKSAKRNSLASSSLAWLQARAQKLIEQVVTGTAKQAYVATVFAVYYTEAYDREDIKRSHVNAGMVHHDGRDGPDFMAALHTTRAELTQSYLDMVMHVRSDFLRKSSRIGETIADDRGGNDGVQGPATTVQQRRQGVRGRHGRRRHCLAPSA